MLFNKRQKKNEAKLEVMVFTDPYCSWCWATEPMILSMMEKYRDQIHFRYVFGGLIEDFDDFYDADNDIRDAAATKPHWKMVSERTGQPINEDLWEDIAPIRHFSTWPANIAAKAAYLQGEDIGFRYLRRLRRAALTERKIISKPDIYEPLAQEIDGLDFDRFKEDIASGKAKKSFYEDQKICIAWQTFAFPTMLFYKHGVKVEDMNRTNASYVGGHRPMETYDEVIHMLCPDIKTYPVRSEEELIKSYGPLTERELEQIQNRTREEELAVLTQLETAGTVTREAKRRGNMWSLPQLSY